MILHPLKRDNIALAATIVLVRNSDRGLELYLTERPGRVDFPALHVFPGGKVSAADDRFAERLHAGDRSLVFDRHPPAETDALLGEALSLRYWLAVVRELFEEVGVLLALKTVEGSAPRPLDAADVDRLSRFRQALDADELALDTFCREQGLRLTLDAVHYFSHWLTPAAAPRRFDTRFFVAELPTGQQPAPDAREVVAATWATPAQALAEHAAGNWQMIGPTLETLRSVECFRNTHELFASVADGTHLPELSDALRREGMAEPHAASRADGR
ncbi:MAG: hypothetical protein AAF648_00500 [Pseudomonadota bacterium]